MTQPGQPGDPGQPPRSAPPSWQQAPQQPAPPSWQQQPQQPQPQQQPPPSWQQAPQQPRPPAPPVQPPSWSAALTSTAPVAGPAGYFYADVPNRAVAMVIDVIAMGLLYLIVGIIAVGIFGTTSDFVQSPSVASLLVQTVISYALWGAYFVYTWSSARGTLGMRLLGMQIGGAADGRSLTVNQAATRFAVLFGPQFVISVLVAFVPDLGWLSWLSFGWLIYVLVTIAQSPTKQGIHDRLAQSMVVKAGRRAA